MAEWRRKQPPALLEEEEEEEEGGGGDSKREGGRTQSEICCYCYTVSIHVTCTLVFSLFYRRGKEDVAN